MRRSLKWLTAVTLGFAGARLLAPRPSREVAPPSPPSLRPLWISGALILVAAAAYVGALGLRQQSQDRQIAQALTGGDMRRAHSLIRRYGCGGCHSISGVPGADGQVGGPLDGIRQRVFIAGTIRNSPEALMQWIVAPQEISPRSAMPRTGITPEEARDVAAFLYSH